MRIEPSGVVMIGECEIQTPFCTALRPAPITAVWGSPGRRQINVCRRCLEEMVRLGEWENPGARIRRVFDLAVYDAAGYLQLIVEIKKRPYEVATDLEDWATRIHRNLLTHSGVPSSAFFLFAVCPGPFYLWTKAEAPNPEISPQFTIDAQALLQDYQPSQPPRGGEEGWCEDMIQTWLWDLVQSQQTPGRDPSQDWLFQSGLYQAIQGGQVVRQASTVRLREPQAA